MTKTEGELVRYAETSGESGPVYFPILRLTLPDGRQVSMPAREGENEPRLLPGARVKLLYSLDETVTPPQVASVDVLDTFLESYSYHLFNAFGYVLFGGLFIATGIGQAISRR